MSPAPDRAAPRRRRIVFASHGSLGDLAPFLEIGKALAERGHKVTIATHAAHAAAVAASGLSMRPMRPDFPADAGFQERFMDTRHGTGLIFREFLGPALKDSFHDLDAVVRDADLLVSVTLALAAPLVAEKRRIRWLSAVFQPAMLFSAYDPPRFPALPAWRGGGRLAVAWNRYLYVWARLRTLHWVRPIRRTRRELGLRPGPGRGNPIFAGQHSPGGVLALFSPLIGEPQPDWPPRTVQTGAVLPQSGAGLDPTIARFLDEGAPPIVFTLGASSAWAARDFFHESLAASRSLGRPALLLVGSCANLAALPSPLPADAFAAVAAPYRDVFARASVVVHPGGIGTTQIALAAGRPMLIAPFAHDQHDNAARAARLGAALVLPHRRYRATAAAAALRRLEREPSFAEAAARAAAAIAREDGIAAACAAIERMLLEAPPHPPGAAH
jgi:UDP:flavonoid glycosyltransferase YjiC (YdhE family)